MPGSVAYPLVSVCSLGQGVPRGQHLLDLFSAEPRPGPAPAPPPGTQVGHRLDTCPLAGRFLCYSEGQPLWPGSAVASAGLSLDGGTPHLEPQTEPQLLSGSPLQTLRTRSGRNGLRMFQNGR